MTSSIATSSRLISSTLLVTSTSLSPSLIPSTTTGKLESPFVPYPSSSVDSQPANQSRSRLTKFVVEWLFFVIAFTVFMGIVFWTCHRFRRRRRRRHQVPMRSIEIPPYDLPRPPRPARLPSSDISSASIMLANPILYPSSYSRPPRRNTLPVNAIDTDAGGRRLGAVSSDHDLELGDKDTLPPYDKSGSPPRYAA